MNEENQTRLVVRRFNSEVEVWDDVHSGNNGDIIQWEIRKRKALSRDFIQQRFRGRAARILEIGCGAGRNLEEIVSANGNWSGKGVDVAPAMIDACRTRYQSENRLSFEVMDIEREHLEERFDVILMLGVVGYLTNNSVAFANAQRMLRPGGFVILTFGKAPSVSRFVRSASRRCKRQIRRAASRMAQRLFRQRNESEQTLFRCFSRSEIERSFPSEWRLLALYNIAFGTGILGTTSVRISQTLERIFAGRDPMLLALTCLLIVTDTRRG